MKKADGYKFDRKLPKFLRNAVTSSSGWKSKPSKVAYNLVFSWCLLGFLFSPQYVGSTFFRNVGKLLTKYAVSHSRK
jgi:hypothetical protein